MALVEGKAGEIVKFNWDQSLGRILEIQRFQAVVTERAYMEIGRELTFAKDNLKHGEFINFVETAGYKINTANLYMRAAAMGANCDQITISEIGMRKIRGLMSLPETCIEELNRDLSITTSDGEKISWEQIKAMPSTELEEVWKGIRVTLAAKAKAVDMERRNANEQVQELNLKLKRATERAHRAETAMKSAAAQTRNETAFIEALGACEADVNKALDLIRPYTPEAEERFSPETTGRAVALITGLVTELMAFQSMIIPEEINQ